RKSTSTVSQFGTRSMSASTQNELSKSSLSASGSRIAPSSVFVSVRRAIAPSRASGTPPATNTASATPGRPPVRRMRNAGIVRMRTSVRTFGTFSTLGSGSELLPQLAGHLRRRERGDDGRAVLEALAHDLGAAVHPGEQVAAARGDRHLDLDALAIGPAPDRPEQPGTLRPARR